MQHFPHILRRPATYDAWTAAGLNLMLGLWLMMSAWVVGYAEDRAFWVPVGTGALVAASAYVRLGTNLRTKAVYVADLVLAAWLLVAAVWIAEAAKPFWNDAVCGFVLATLAVTGLAAERLGMTRRD